MEFQGFNRRLLVPLLVVIILIMMVQNYFLVQRNQESQTRIERLTEEINKKSVMAEGELMSAFAAMNLDGQRVLIDPQKGGKKRLFLVFATWCGACMTNMGQWNWIVSNSHQMKEVEIIGICPDSISRIRSYRDSLKLSFPVFSISVDTTVLKKYKFGLFPQTVLIDSTGSVIKIWSGVLSDKKRKEVESTI